MGEISNKTGFAVLRAARAWWAGKRPEQFAHLEECMAAAKAELDAKPARKKSEPKPEPIVEPAQDPIAESSEGD